ncbi:MAG: hypothetical protein QME60_04070 [Verrucomicrobiota bacterium]|nr:hypothetical protein [Verrucomicrobiota bacterium]
MSNSATLVLYPINPATLSRYREAFSPSRTKDDPSVLLRAQLPPAGSDRKPSQSHRRRQAVDPGGVERKLRKNLDGLPQMSA